MWIAYALTSAFFAGITAILAKIGIKRVDTHLATALRTVIVALFAWLMVFIVGSEGTIGDISQRTLIFLILSGFATGGSWLCYFRALQLGDVNRVTPIDKSSTVLTMILAMLFLSEPITWLKAVSMALILGGTYAMIERKEPAAQRQADKRWLLYAIFSAVFASLTAILGKIGIEGVESNLGTAIRTLVVLVMAWLIVLLGGKQREIRGIDRKSWLFLALSGLATGLSWMCYYRALQDGLASVVVPIDKLSILVTAAFAVFVLKEPMPKRSAAGLGVLTAGILLLLI